ncbi:sensor histidine kinase [Paenibacillus chitinolyticus]|uniref:histidine kinase n=2 Tax=Paenibacillus chitinolyticus TaxID=79263 RepID=A0ABT4FCB9_9BACL|nr:HAMP domain-containing sensor histidine kinase [Paenibacillus chitinolyticus]MCY9594068.1 HAMP domain-containing histidine kinase [Paenibacillus chitinolyticus]MCY9596153.1 HAMP domain-containing histidine kinase [Paenibacillus chitinolyticus]
MNKLLSLIFGKRSIRVRMFWSFILSLTLAMNVSSLLNESLLNSLLAARHFPYLSIVLYGVLSTVSFIVLFILSFSLMTRRIVQYLLSLAEGLDYIAGGNLRHRVPLLRKDELGRVAENINAMAEKLERQIAKERQIQKSQMDLITGVSHDLRTPLTNIIGYLELLKNRVYHNEQEQERFVDITYNKAMQLKNLIDDLFEYTRLTTSDAKFVMGQFDIRELLSQIAAEFQPFAKEHGVTVETYLAFKSMPIPMDPGKIRRVIDNLLMNALKFSVKPGVVRVSLEARPPFVAIKIENEGTPISKEQEELLFGRFYKADHSRTANAIQTGSGLGLSIVKSIVERHNGTLSLVHSSGHFTFIIELPLTTAAHDDEN